MTDATALTNRLRRLNRLPYGRARTTATETIVREVEAHGPETLLPEALLELVEAYTFSGEAAHAYVPFARALRLWDSSPELFDEADQHTLFWQFKWIASSPASDPQINAPQAEALIDDMERRYRLAGLSLAPVEKIRMGWLWHAGLDHEEARRRWEGTTSDSIADCPACDTAMRVALHLDAGRFDEAVAVARTQTRRCNREPAGTWFDLALAQLRRGRVADALEALGDARRAMESDETEPYSQWYGQEFEVLALAGRLDQALARLAASWTPAVLRGDNPRDRFDLLVGLTAGLAGHRERFVEAWVAPPAFDASLRTLGDLYSWAHAEALRLAGAFDARNETPRYTRLVERAERATIVATTPVAGSSTPGADEGVADAASGAEAALDAEPNTKAPSVETDAPSAGDPVALWRHAESLGSRHPDAADAYERAARAAEDAGLLDDAGLAWSESAQASSLADAPARAHQAFLRGVRLLAAGDAPLPLRSSVVEAWAAVAAQMGGADEALPVLLAELAGLDSASDVDAGTPLGRACLAYRARCQDAVARLGAGSPEAAGRAGLTAEGLVDLAQDAAGLFERAGLLADAAHAAWLAARLLAEQRRTQEAVMAYESVLAALAHLRQRAARARAAGELIDLFAEIGDQAAIDRVARTLTD